MASDDQVTVEYRNNGDAEAGDGVVEVLTPGDKNSVGVIPLQRRNSRIPVLFERAAKSWWDPKFDSRILERHHTNTYFNQIRTRFRYALGYIILSCIAWCIFFGLTQDDNWVSFLGGSIVLVVITAGVLGFTYFGAYRRLVLPISVGISLCLCIFFLLSFVYPQHHISDVGKFTGVIEILLMIYTVIPLPLYLSVILGVLLSIIFEVISGIKTDMHEHHIIVGRALLHICIHLIAVHIFIMSQVRKRSTFLKVGQSIMSRKDLEFEKQLKHQMIHSLMPPQVAEEVMRSRGQEDKKDEEDSPGSRRQKDPEIPSFNFRSFHMTQMDDTSILFADIVGFTKMSSNKTAEHLVSLLNDLFGRFDVICSDSGCEKISTLGDCYYCVSGCPTPKPDHAQCCVEMGLSMCKAIEDFDRDHQEEVDMRVGVHTGTVLCGLVGTRRFKFDVWSHDVTLANTMESSGEPGRVHISDATLSFVKDLYEVDPGKDVTDIRSNKKLTECFDVETQQYIVKHVEDTDVIKTWFIKGRKQVAGSPEEGSTENVTKDESAPAAEEVQITVEEDETKETQEDAKSAEEVETNNSQKDTIEKSRETNHLETSQLSVSLVDANLEPSPVVNDSEHSQTDHLLPDHPTDNNNSNKTCHIGNSTHLHIEGNEMSTASLLGKRENQAQSTEDLDTDNKETTDTALMENLVSPRLHEQSDKQLIQRMESDQSRAEEYLYRPPINQCTLKFIDDRLESKYHRHYLDKDRDTIQTLALPKFSALCDMTVSCIFFVLVSVCCFLGFQPYQVGWLVVFGVAMCLELLMLVPLFCITCSLDLMSGRMKQVFSSWYVRHIFGSVIASLPPVAVFVNFRCSLMADQTEQMFYCLLLIATLLHYCNFTMLSSWMKSSLATIAGVALLVLFAVDICTLDSDTVSYNYQNETATGLNTTITTGGSAIFKHEIILDIVLFLFLVWFLNREFEISYRLSFHGDQQALLDRQNMQVEKEQADWLLHNIIPEHVAEIVKKTSKYCENHKDVGVVFASVTNFDNFYDESFEGGKEYLRVLNELMGDFEELFDDPKYKDIEKIKTIGSCLMASAGLNPQTRQQNKDSNAHLYALMDFCIDLLAKLEQFNAEIFNFDFEMKIGFNFGEVTSGVIGTTKLLYDIWGDTVNISSRMYSTGVQGKIQVTGYTATKLQDKFDFEYRGKIFVKGKGDMDTYILVKKKPDATWE